MSPKTTPAFKVVYKPLLPPKKRKDPNPPIAAPPSAMTEYALPKPTKFKQQTQKILNERLKHFGTNTVTPQGRSKPFSHIRNGNNYEKTILEKILRSRKPLSTKLCLIRDFYSKC